MNVGKSLYNGQYLALVENSVTEIMLLYNGTLVSEHLCDMIKTYFEVLRVPDDCTIAITLLDLNGNVSLNLNVTKQLVFQCRGFCHLEHLQHIQINYIVCSKILRSVYM